MTDSNQASEETAIEKHDNPALTILLTAGISATGQALTRTLTERGHKVYAVVDTAAAAQTIRELGGFPTFLDLTRAGEITSALKMSGATVIVHLDPLTGNHVPFQARDWDADRLRDSALALTEGASAIEEPPFIVYPSYAFLYAASDEPVTEDAPLRSAGESPLLKAALDAERAITGADIPYCLLRVGYIYGPHDPALNVLFETLRAGRPVSTGDGHANWVHSDDLADALVRVVEAQPAGETFNIVDDDPASPAAFMEHFVSMLGMAVPEGFLLRLGRLFGNKSANMLLALDAQASNARARESLGWQPKYPDRETGLAQTLLIWRAESVT